MAAILLLCDGEAERRERRPRDFKPRKVLADICEREIQNYRFPRNFIQDLAGRYEQSPFSNSTSRSHALSAETEMLIALRWFGKGGIMPETAGFHQVSKSSASRAIRKVANYLVSLAPQVINFPENRQSVVQAFHQKYHIPCTVGVIDGTHINIVAPSEEEHAYVNRKQHHSINTQIICDSDLRIMDLDCRWPGRTHDSFILEMSPVAEMFEQGGFNGLWLLGDSGYPCKSWLMTPLMEARTAAARRYNTAQKSARCVIERCIGVLKSRFRCLTSYNTTGLQLQPSAVCPIVLACAVLHNFAIDLHLPDPANEEYHNDQQEGEEGNEFQVNDRTGVRTRENLIRQYYSR